MTKLANLHGQKLAEYICDEMIENLRYNVSETKKRLDKIMAKNNNTVVVVNDVSPVYPPVSEKAAISLNDVHTKPLDKVWSEPTPTK